MPRQLLSDLQVVGLLKHSGRSGVTQIMKTEVFYPGSFDCRPPFLIPTVTGQGISFSPSPVLASPRAHIGEDLGASFGLVGYQCHQIRGHW